MIQTTIRIASRSRILCSLSRSDHSSLSGAHLFLLVYKQNHINIRPALSGILVLRLLLPFLIKLGPAKFRAFLVKIAPSKRVQRIREMIDTMEQTSIEILDIKKRAIEAGDHTLMDQIGQGKDLMSILRT